MYYGADLSTAAVSGMLAAFPVAHRIDASKCMPHMRHELHAEDLFKAIRRGCQLRHQGVPVTSVDLHGCDTLTIVELTILLETLDTLQCASSLANLMQPAHIHAAHGMPMHVGSLAGISICLVASMSPMKRQSCCQSTRQQGLLHSTARKLITHSLRRRQNLVR